MPDRMDGPLCVWCRKRPVDHRWRPFCSERCKLQDLGRWADGSYLVPGETVDDPEHREHSEKEDS